MRRVRLSMPHRIASDVFPSLHADTPDGERLAQVRSERLLMIGGKCSGLRAKSGKVSGHLPADPEQIERLKLGVDSWNSWRIENPDVQPDFFEADLGRAKLIRADLHGANLRVANLFEADLGIANLSGANLSRSLFLPDEVPGCVFPLFPRLREDIWV